MMIRPFYKGEQADVFYPQFEDAMDLIKRRALWLGEIYPFRQENGEVLFAPQTSKKHYLWYLFLLVCSCHNRISSLQHDLSVQFENLCKEAMRALFPDWAEVFLFSQNSDDRKKLGWSAKKAIPALAKKLNTQVKPNVQLPNTQEEYGIDLIAICSFGDELEYPFFRFPPNAQFQEESGGEKEKRPLAHRALSGVVTLETSHTNFLLIPHFPRVNATEWRKPRQYPINCILCDRYRICRLLEKSNPFTQQNMPPGISEIVQEIQKHLPKSY